LSSVQRTSSQARTRAFAGALPARSASPRSGSGAGVLPFFGGVVGCFVGFPGFAAGPGGPGVGAGAGEATGSVGGAIASTTNLVRRSVSARVGSRDRTRR